MNLLPLEVLPGWPEPEPQSDLLMLMLTIVGPIAAVGLVALLYLPQILRKDQDQAPASTEVEVSEGH